MSLEDSEFEDDDKREDYRRGENYRKMAATEGWKQIRAEIEANIRLKLEDLETCEVAKVEKIRGYIAGHRRILDDVDGFIESADAIEREIKNIPQEDSND